MNLKNNNSNSNHPTRKKMESSRQEQTGMK
ncbi:hypothetical protein LINPERPRIM_LOCUS40297 [Linum perenne]